ncbi:MAG: lytic murein transglycosylase [Alphaproteobacteria bacterium]|nr:lytic murein transglycosylase [Alphaproteobacteria bacterium]MBU0797068.1 lytic murein transglycosylase [Alphaproteobacteria bacterium]MBU0887875.1 lytic murein transglycosylase [Alphaproteobacteria bacterium]MBU1814902.1 lytic murein transglycosylase [Alphaproteobacteria bacterium]MBU2090625.1 lytic murein transglycosylase [Alphaproteobacteria bacterium]
MAGIVGLGFAIGSAAQANDQPFDVWLQGVRAEAAQKGIRQATLDAALTGVQPIPRVIELDRKQPEFTLTFQQYIDRVVPQSRIDKGRAMLAEHGPVLERISQQYRVPPRIIVALWGIETDFGRVTGNFSVIASLATLAHDGRRSAFFRKELMDALTIIDEGHITAKAMIGSWAGAMGQNQFMPSSFRAYAVDYTGDGKRDIWSSQPDIFASIANYISKSGWKDDRTWGRQVQLPAGFDISQAEKKVTRSISEWQALGVRRVDGSDLPARDLSAMIVLPALVREGTGGPAFMVYENFETILKWNRSTYFAVAVGKLSDALGNIGSAE